MASLLGAPAAGAPPAAAPTVQSLRYAWRNVVIRGGGFVTGIVFNPAQRGLLYARTDIGGAYRWDATARTWVPLLDWVTRPDWNLMGVESLASDALEPNRLYLAAGTYTNPDVGNGEILRSQDYGRSFERTPLPFKFGANEAGRGSGERLVVDPNENRILYFGTRRDGLWRSQDYGASFQRVSSFPDVPDDSAHHQNPNPGHFDYLSQAVGVVLVLFDARSGRRGSPTPTLYAAVSRSGPSLFRSGDAGASWQPVPGQPLGFRPTRAALSPDGSLYLTVADEPGPNRMRDGRVFKLDTASGHWSDVTPETPPPGGTGFGYAAVAVDAAHPSTLLVTSWNRSQPHDEIFRSLDGGKTWRRLLENAHWDQAQAPYTRSMHHHWMSDVQIDPFDPDHALFTTGFGIWATRELGRADRGEATRWSFEDAGLEETVPLALKSPPEGAHLLSGLGDIDGFRHDRLDVSPAPGKFDAPGFKNTEWLDFAERAPRVWVRAGTTYGHDRILGAYSEDGGTHWHGFATQPPVPAGARPFPTGPIAVSADGAGIVWTPRDNSAFRSLDRGKSWQAVAGSPKNLRVVADRVDESVFYGYDAEQGVLYLSQDGAERMAPVQRGLPTLERSHWRPAYADLQAVPGRRGELWLTLHGKLLHLSELGAASAELEGIEDVSALGLGKAPPGRDAPALFASGRVAGAYGLYRSDDGGASWLRLNDALHQFGSISIVCGDPRVFGRLYVGTGGRGIVWGEPLSR